MSGEYDSKRALRAEYTARINRVMDHVERNLGRDLTLDDLASVANFSKYHFHRIFHALVGETLSDFIRRVRLERAAAQLADDPAKPVIAIALDCGFSGPAVFARAFRERFGMRPANGGNAAAPPGARSAKRIARTVNRSAIRAKNGTPPSPMMDPIPRIGFIASGGFP